MIHRQGAAPPPTGRRQRYSVDATHALLHLIFFPGFRRPSSHAHEHERRSRNTKYLATVGNALAARKLGMKKL